MSRFLSLLLFLAGISHSAERSATVTKMVAAETDIHRSAHVQVQVVSNLTHGGGVLDVSQDDDFNKTHPIFEDCSVPLTEMVDHLNSHLTDLDDILLWAHKRCPEGKLIQVTSFGASGMVILHKMSQLGILGAIPTVSLDTLHLFPETYDFIDRVQSHFDDMCLRKFRPLGFDHKSAFVAEHGTDLWRSDPHEYDRIVKVEPMLRAFEELRPSAWITGRRSSQGSERTDLNVFEIDHDDPTRVKINPLAHWTYDQVWEYIKKNDIPYNPLHDRGYKSIGDVQTTRPVARDADERSGRFLGLEGKTECGLHSRNRPKRTKSSSKKQDATDASRLSPQTVVS
mmetsp:Transcript_43053/g.79867  ORF Transcript_43053/g.79867 Transcript_43053/m.79867 type:complete len:340 (-) Transcript_43053:120-1139(-)